MKNKLSKILYALCFILIFSFSANAADTLAPVFEYIKFKGNALTPLAPVGFHGTVVATIGYINPYNLENNFYSIGVSDKQMGDTGLQSIAANLYKKDLHSATKKYWYWSINQWGFISSVNPNNPENQRSGFAFQNPIWAAGFESPTLNVTKQTLLTGKYLEIEGNYNVPASFYPTLSDGDLLSIQFFVLDKSNRCAESYPYTFYYDSTFPTISITPPPNKTADPITGNYYFNSTDLASGFSGSAADTISWIESVSIEIYAGSSPNFWSWNGTAWVSSGSSILRIPATHVLASGTWTYNNNMTTLIAGLINGDYYRINAFAKDRAGNNNYDSFTFLYDNAPPTNPQNIMAFTESYLNKTLPVGPSPADPKEITNLSWRKDTSIRPYIYFADGTDNPGSGIKSYDFKLIRWPDLFSYGRGEHKSTLKDITISYQDQTIYSLTSQYFNSGIYEVIPPTAPLSDGWYKVRIKASDKAGNDAATAKTFSFGIDTHPPTKATNLAVAPDSGGIAYKWTPGTDATSDLGNPTIYLKGPGPTPFALLEGKATIDTITEIKTDSGGKNYYVSTSKLTPGNYAFYVVTRDLAGNTIDSDQKPFSVTLPAPTLVSPTNNKSTNTLPVFSANTVSLPSGSPNSIKSYKLLIYDSSTLKNSVPGSPPSSGSTISWNTVNDVFAAKTYSWKVAAIDNFDNQTDSTPRNFTLTQPVSPTIPLLSPTDGKVKTESSVTFTWTTSTAFAGYDIYIGGSKDGSTASGIGTYTKNLADGAHQWYVQSTATIGNSPQTITSLLYTVKVDTKDPTLTLSAPKDKDTSSTSSVTFSWIPSYKLSDFGLYLDGIRVKNTTEKKLTQTLADGKHTWYVTSAYRGKTITTGEHALTVNAEGPKIEVKIKEKALENDIVVSPTDNLSVTISDQFGIDNNSIQVLVNGKPQAKSKVVSKDTSGKTVALSSKLSLSEGTHSIKITAKDALGKENSVSFTGIKAYSGNVRLLAKPMNYPNPFKPSSGAGTTINYTLSDNANIKIMIFDIGGRMVWQNSYPSGSSGGSVGENEVLWYGKSAASEILGNGVYLYTVTSGGKLLDRGEIAIFE
ncbi:MAG: T9SS type A sorting domain-containing protein [Candidatus Saganbacteria bacterium]|nr:T9SS type A sorting domain-containing protein [Candidatus Saganbacteria bacterium]